MKNNKLIEVQVIPANPLPSRYYNWQNDDWQEVDPYEVHGVRWIRPTYSSGEDRYGG